ncbi:MAG: hypothetical protein ACKO2P_07630 [Planctomycetota bacterium]
MVSSRYMLWIDGVGAWLVCCGTHVVLGSAAPDAVADIRLQAPLARRHALLELSGENWLLKPLQVSTDPAEDLPAVTTLAPDSLIPLTARILLRFRVPSVLSSSAVLTMESTQRLVPHADGAILLADRMLLGPGSDSHIRCPGLTDRLVISAGNDRLWCRSTAGFQVNGQATGLAAEVEHGTLVSTGDFRLRVERI